MEEQINESSAHYAYAKINLSLEVLSKRPDGFHELATVMQTVGLYDTLYISLAEDLQFDCNVPELVDENNLVWRAALELFEQCPSEGKRGANIYLQKGVPIAAGLGGGSSDAATTLVALNRLWQLNLPPTVLEDIAVRLGSDVPFFLQGGTALVEGRGERLTPLPEMTRTWLVLLYPPLDLPENKTAQLYKMLDRNDFSSGHITRALVNAIQRGEMPSQSLLYNTFEHVIYERFPQLDLFRQAMVDAGAYHVQVSGSGPTLYSLMESQEEAEALVTRLAADGYTAFAVSTVQP